MVVFQVVAWDARDVEDEYTITAYGRTQEGGSVALSFAFQPYLFVRSSDMGSFATYKTVKTREFVEAKDLWGFQNSTKVKFVKLGFTTLKDMKFAESNLRRRYAGAKKNHHFIYEANIDPLLRFMHRTGISSTGWINTGDKCIRSYNNNCTFDLYCQDWKSLKPVERDDIAPLRIMSLDIECYSADGSFPDPEKEDTVVFQIGMTTKVFGKSEYMDRTCLCLKRTMSYNAKSFTTEKDLLCAFQEHLQKIDPDIITGWNLFGFDLEYLYKRLGISGCTPDAYVWGRQKDRTVDLVIKNLASNALGNNMLKMVPMCGRYVFDLFQDVKREHKLESYSLNNVSKHFLKDQKNDMPVKEIFKRYADGNAQLLGEVADYCIKDTELPHDLMAKLCTIQNLIEMAKATWVPMSFLSERGQQIKVFSQMTRKARELGFMVPTIPYKREKDPDDEEGYKGATVLDAQTGAYYGPITALDFASLYPSIMCAHNLCYSSLVMDPKYDNLPGVQYEQFGPYKFAQGTQSLLPAILTELKEFRKKAKKDMAAAEGTPMEAVYNGKQLAYKISMNSVYGFTGAVGGGMLPLVAIASTVTMRGRQMIEETKDYVEANFPGAKVRYGDTDSVMVEFDVGGRKGQEAIDYSWNLGEQAAEACTKLFKAPNDLELEKVYCPYFLYSKKRYAAKMYEGKSNKDGTPVLKEDGTRVVAFKKIDVKGLQVVRRDNCLYVREVCKAVLGHILEGSDPAPAIQEAKAAAKELLAGRVPMEKLTLSKQLGSDYKSNNHTHLAVRDKIRQRAPGSEPQQGDRVQYVIVEGPKKAKLYEKSEDPAWVREHGIKLDYNYYFSNQLKNPITDLLEPLIGEMNIFQDM
jgi:DNA polymerase delta subunit 1